MGNNSVNIAYISGHLSSTEARKMGGDEIQLELISETIELLFDELADEHFG